MKILIVNSLYPPYTIGGAGQSVQAVAEGIRDRSHQPIVVTLTPKQEKHRNSVNGIKVHYLPLKNIYWPFDRRNPSLLRKALWHGLDAYNPWMKRNIRNVINDENPDLVHTNALAGFSAAIWSTVKSAFLPLVHTLWDHYLMCLRSTMFRRGDNCDSICWDCRGPALVRRRLSRQPDMVISNSQAVLERHQSRGYFEGTPCRVIHNAYPAPEETPDPSSASSDTFTIGYLGRLDEPKGVEFMLETLSGNLKSGWTVKVAGTGKENYERGLRRRFSDSDVDFLGYVEWFDFLPSVDVLVVPSLCHDTLPRTIFEAFHFGVPVVGARRGGIPEAIRDGETGLLFDPDEPDELIHCLERLERDEALQENVSRRARATTEYFLEDRMVDEYEACYRDVLDQ